MARIPAAAVLTDQKGGMMTSTKRTPVTKAKATATSRPSRPFVLASLVGVAVGVAWLLFGRGPNFAAEAKTLQQQLLVEDVSPQQRQQLLASLMRHVDKLDSAAQRKLMVEVRQQWREIQQQDMDAYFAATSDDRQAALDRALDRLVLIGDLAAAFSPGGMRVRQPRSQTPAEQKSKAPSPPRPPEEDAATIVARRKAMEAYASALEKRARERGLEVPFLGRRRQRG